MSLSINVERFKKIRSFFSILVRGVSGGWAIAHPLLGIIEGAAGQERRAALLLAHPVLGSYLRDYASATREEVIESRNLTCTVRTASFRLSISIRDILINFRSKSPRNGP